MFRGERRGSLHRQRMYSHPSEQQPPQQLPWPHLLGLLVEHRRHGEDGAALIQRGREALPLLVQLGGNLLDLLRGIMTGLREAGSHGHDAVDVDIGILGNRGEGALSGASWNNTHRAHLGVGEYLGKEATQSLREAGTGHTSIPVFGPREVCLQHEISPDRRYSN